MKYLHHINPEQFPTLALGPRLSKVVHELSAETKASASPIAAALFSQISLVCQGLIDVETRPGLISPVSLYFMSIQGSGELKTAIFQLASKGVRAFSLESTKLHHAAKSKHQAELAAWGAEGRGIQAAVRKKSELSEDPSSEFERLDAHFARKPAIRKGFKLMHENVTPSALIRSLETFHPTTALISDEALVVLSGRGLSDPGLINKIFDGSPIIVDRVGHGETMIEKPALTVSLAMQPGVFNNLMERRGDQLRDSGLLARCFVIAPPPMAGFRFANDDGQPDSVHVEWFYERCVHLLRAHATDEQGELPPRTTLKLSPAAFERWNAEFNMVEYAMQSGGLFYQFRDFGSKHANKIARMSALLHFFDGEEGPISLNAIERAIEICSWLANEYVRVFTTNQPARKDIADANAIRDWLVQRHIRAPHDRAVRKNELLQLGPNPVRSKSALNAALRNLVYWGDVVEWRDIPSRKTFVALTEQFVQRLPVYSI